jgi:hypothetical protein
MIITSLRLIFPSSGKLLVKTAGTDSLDHHTTLEAFQPPNSRKLLALRGYQQIHLQSIMLALRRPA